VWKTFLNAGKLLQGRQVIALRCIPAAKVTNQRNKFPREKEYGDFPAVAEGVEAR
jgi:hypothetical protein